MTRLAAIGKAGRGGFAFAASSCLSILIALVCALAPLGLPASVTAGSAFNPATTSVMLKARAPVSARQIEATRPDGGGTGMADAAAFVALMPALWPWAMARVSATEILSFPSTFASSLHLHSVARARAPPLIS